MARKSKVKGTTITGLIKDALDGVQGDIISNMNAYGRNASFRSIRSLRTEVKFSNGSFVGIIHGSKSFTWMEQGSGPARSRSGDKHHLRNIIYKWLIDKGISPAVQSRKKYSTKTWSNGMMKLAKLIAFRIQQRGTKLRRSRSKQDIYTSSMQTRYNDLQTKITDYIFQVEIEKSFDL